MQFNFGKVLENVYYPSDIRKLSTEKLLILACDIRKYMIEVISKVGGHLGSGLGVVELTIALHYVFNTPEDKIIWDIGHQSYPHKILTGRKELLPTIRQDGGISGFCKISESEYDVFGAGHSSTSISAGLGIAIARDLSKQKFNVISVIGDSAMTAGMAYEALNHAGSLHTKMIVILNDNEMSIAPAVGALRNYLVKLMSSQQYVSFRNLAKQLSNNLPNPIKKLIKNAEVAAKDAINGANIFEAMGFYYIGPVDGHDLPNLIQILEKIKDINLEKPILLHIKTTKGRGYDVAEKCYEKCHGVSGKKSNNISDPILARHDVIEQHNENELIGTTFIPKKTKKAKKIKRELAFETGINISGFIKINHTLEKTFSTRNTGISLLPIGIIECSDGFEKGDILAIKSEDDRLLGYCMAGYSSNELKENIGKQNCKPFVRCEYMYML